MSVYVNDGIVNESLVEITLHILRIERQQTTIIIEYIFSEICS